MRTIGFFSAIRGVGTSTIVRHLAWMYEELGIGVLIVDLDPQASLTSELLSYDRLLEIWPDGPHPETILGWFRDLGSPTASPSVEILENHVALLPGNLGLSLFEDRLADAWPRCLDDKAPEAHDAFRVMTAFYRAAKAAAASRGAEIVLIDVGPSLGALNRAALVACDFVVMPLGADLYSLQGLRNLGPALDSWRKGWKKRLKEKVPPALSMPSGDMAPLGYIILQHAVRMDRPVKAYQRWAARIPEVYWQSILGQPPGMPVPDPDPHRLSSLKHYRSLMPLAQDARKPMFLLKPADGALGAHAQAVMDCYQDFKRLALRIATAAGVKSDQHSEGLANG